MGTLGREGRLAYQLLHPLGLLRVLPVIQHIHRLLALIAKLCIGGAQHSAAQDLQRLRVAGDQHTDVVGLLGWGARVCVAPVVPAGRTVKVGGRRRVREGLSEEYKGRTFFLLALP